MRLRTGAEMRVTGPADATAAVVCLNGGQSREVEGTWSATLEWLVRRLAPDFPRLTFCEVKYRIKSWRLLDACVDDARPPPSTRNRKESHASTPLASRPPSPAR